MSLCATNVFSPLEERNFIYPLICVEEGRKGEMILNKWYERK